MISGNLSQANGISIRVALLKKKPFKKYLQSLNPLQEITEIVPLIYNSTFKLSISELKDFWYGCKLNAKQNKLYLLMWKERRELLELRA